MWEKVNVTEDGKLIRVSDKQQIGELYVPVLYRAEISVYKVDGQVITPHQGYVDEKGVFHELCTAIGCSIECLNKRHPDCRYQLKGDQTQGMYIEV